MMPSNFSFLSTLSLRRATLRCWQLAARDEYFYPRSPCGERRRRGVSRYLDKLISIHALLAESDARFRWFAADSSYFYPRSPCGERRRVDFFFLCCIIISIHALLAESDVWPITHSVHPLYISIHALLAESDSKSAQNSGALLRI